MTDYSEIGLQPNLIKYTSPLANMVDPESQIEDASIRGIKITDKSVNLGKLYGQDLELGGSSNISGRIRAYDENMAEMARLSSTGLQLVGSSSVYLYPSTGISEFYKGYLGASATAVILASGLPTADLQIDSTDEFFLRFRESGTKYIYVQNYLDATVFSISQAGSVSVGDSLAITNDITSLRYFLDDIILRSGKWLQIYNSDNSDSAILTFYAGTYLDLGSKGFNAAGYYALGSQGQSPTLTLLDGDGVTQHTLNFTGGILTSYT